MQTWLLKILDRQNQDIRVRNKATLEIEVLDQLL